MAEVISIVPMMKSDVLEVTDIGVNTSQLQIDDSKNMYYDPETIIRALNSQSEICLVAKSGNILAGFFIAHINEIFREVYISDIALKPEFRGQGIGQKLMQEAEKILKSKDISWSWALVQEGNLPMHKFMEKQGYIKGKAFNFYYKPSDF